MSFFQVFRLTYVVLLELIEVVDQVTDRQVELIMQMLLLVPAKESHN